MLQAQDDEAVTNFVFYKIVQNVDVMKLLQYIMQLIIWKLNLDNLNMIALEMY